MVYVLVGADKKRFAIYKGLICHHSKFFRRALNDSSLAASNKGIELSDVSLAIFELIYIWLNHGEFTQSVGAHDIPCTTTQVTWLYIHGEKLEMPKLCNKAVDVLVQSYRNEGIPLLDLSQIYQHTPLTSHLRRLVLTLYTIDPSQTWQALENAKQDALSCPEFLFDICQVLAQDFENVPGMVNAGIERIIEPSNYQQDMGGEANATSLLRPRR